MSISASAETWTVSPKGKADFNNIQAAIDAACCGDEILVYPGTYTSTVDPVVNTSGKVVWLHSSDGPEVTIISGENARTCIVINSGESTNTVIEGFTVSNGSAGSGGDGGGLDCHSSSPSISNCVFSNNYAGWGAGAVINNSSAHFSGCVFLNNTAVHDGGGMTLASGSPVLTNCSFIGNSTEQHYGGGVRTSNSTPSFFGCIFENNHGDRWGGAIMNGGTSVTTITSCTFSGNSCADWLGYDEAGGVYNQPDGGGASSIISNSIFCENTPTHVTGVWTDGGGNCFADTCDDGDGDGLPDPCDAADDDHTLAWINQQGGLFHDPTNWDLQMVPNDLDKAIFDLDAEYQVSFDADATIATMKVASGNPIFNLADSELNVIYGTDPLTIGESFDDNATLIIDGGDVKCSSVILGQFSGSDGSLVLRNGGELKVEDSADIVIGRLGNGQLRVQEGSFIDVTGSSYVGFYPDSYGSVVLDDQGGDWRTEFSMHIKHGSVYVGDQASLQVVLSDLIMYPDGWLGGLGTIDADVLNAGEFVPGDAVDGLGRITVNGDFEQVNMSGGGFGVFKSKIGGLEDFGSLVVNGDVGLAGGLYVEFQDYVPFEGESYAIITSTDEMVGQFSVALFPGLPDGKYMKINYPEETPIQGSGGEVSVEVDTFGDVLDFGDTSSIPIDGVPTSLAVEDFDGDGLDDVAITIAGTPGVLLVLLTGHEGFSSTEYWFSIGDDPRGIAVGDFNGDTLVDLAVACYASNTVSVVLGENAGGFGTVLSYPVGERPVDLIAIKLNNDNFTDLAVSCEGGAEGSGYIEFYTANDSLPFRALAFDQDSVVELGSKPGAIDPGDVNDDKVVTRIIATNPQNETITELRTIIGANGGEDWQVFTHEVGNTPASVVAKDINRDDLTDVVVCNFGDDTVSVLIRDSSGALLPQVALPVGALPDSIAVIDFDADDDNDIVLIASDGNGERFVQVLRSDLNLTGDLIFASAQPLKTSDTIPAIVNYGDIDGDGFQDLVTASVPSDLGLRGAGEQFDLDIRPNTRELTCTDFDLNGDGMVNESDMIIVIGYWGSAGSPGDLNFDGIVNVSDLLIVIDYWGSC